MKPSNPFGLYNNQDFPRICQKRRRILGMFSLVHERFFSSISESNFTLYEVREHSMKKRDSGVQDLAFTLGVWYRGRVADAFICIHTFAYTYFSRFGSFIRQRERQSSFATIFLKCHGITRKDIYHGTITHNAQSEFAAQRFGGDL